MFFLVDGWVGMGGWVGTKDKGRKGLYIIIKKTYNSNAHTHTHIYIYMCMYIHT